MPTCVGFCLYLRGDVLDLVGLLDPVYAPGYNEENDWIMRAQAMGFVAKRANHAFVYHLGSQSFGKVKLDLEQRNVRLLQDRHPHYFPQAERFYQGLDSRIAASAVRVESTGKIRAALDLRHVPPGAVGSATYAIGLARALSRRSEVELTLVTRERAQSAGITARLLDVEDRIEDVDVVHKPAQVFEPGELRLLFASPAHTIITHLDLIAHRTRAPFLRQADADRYRATSALALHAASAVIALSEDSRSEILAEFGLPADEVAVTPPGVEHAAFSVKHQITRLCPAVPDSFFLSMATALPHNNLRNLTEAYALLRRHWPSPSNPPALVLVGRVESIQEGFYQSLGNELPPGVVYLGSVADDVLRNLYRNAMAVVLPCVYESTGLEILEAMAEGTPVVAMPLSAVPEVGGDCVFCPEGLSAAELAKALTRVAFDESLRSDLRRRGLLHIEQFTWDRTAQATLQVYRSAVLQPSSRALRMRRMFIDIINSWSDFSELQGPLGILDACGALNTALRRRLGRELKRIPALGGRKWA
jgi:glycosyltransferase involved in cell wall biosynthesis